MGGPFCILEVKFDQVFCKHFRKQVIPRMRLTSLFVCVVALGAEIASAAFPSISPARGSSSSSSKSTKYSVYNGCPTKFFNSLNKPKPTYEISKVEGVTLNTYNYTIDFSIDSGLTVDELISLTLTAGGTTYTLFSSTSDVEIISDPDDWSFSFSSSATTKSSSEFWVPSIYVSYEWETCVKGGGRSGHSFFGSHKRDARWESRYKFHHPGFKNTTKPICNIKSKYPSTYTYVIGCSGSADLPGYCFKKS